jgi:hypothetical protein
MAPDIVTAIPRGAHVVRVVFADGEVRHVDPSLEPARGRGPKITALVPVG